MSTNLHWTPATPPHGHSLPDALKFALREIYGYPVSVDFTEEEPRTMGVLDGLVSCHIDGAKQLREAAEQHGIVRVWEE